MKIRVQESQLMSSLITSLGANPVQMPYGDVYASLQTGEVDAAENNWPSYEATKHYEVAKYYVTDEHNRVPEMQIVSAMTWWRNLVCARSPMPVSKPPGTSCRHS